MDEREAELHGHAEGDRGFVASPGCWNTCTVSRPSACSAACSATGLWGKVGDTSRFKSRFRVQVQAMALGPASCVGVKALLLSRDTAISDGAAWALSGFAVVFWLEVVVRFLGVGCLVAKRCFKV